MSEGIWRHKDRSNSNVKRIRLHRWRECAIAHSKNFHMVELEREPENSYWCEECRPLAADEFRPVLAWKLWHVMVFLKVPQDAFSQYAARRESDARLFESGRRNHRGSSKEEIPFFIEFLNACRALEGQKPLLEEKVNSSKSNRCVKKKIYLDYKQKMESGDPMFSPAFVRTWSEKFASAPPPAKRARRV
jgi:hypothetical protein